MKYIALPVSKKEVTKLLNTSQFPVNSWEKFKSEENIQKDFSGYITSWIQYQKNFDLLLDFLEDRSTKHFLPEYVMPKKGLPSTVDYFLRAAPNKEFAYNVMYKGIPASYLNPKLKWDEFKDLYVEALYKHDRSIRRAMDADRFIKDGNEDKPIPPLGYLRALKASKFAKRTEGVHHMSSEQDAVVHDGGGDAEYDPDALEDNALYESEDAHLAAYATADDAAALDDSDAAPPVDEEDSEKEEAEVGRPDVVASVTATEEQTKNAWLHHITSPASGKLICYDFAATGKCGREKCRFSHEAADIEHWKKLKDMGPAAFEAFKKSYQAEKARRASMPAPKDTSPGVRYPFKDPRSGKVPQRAGVPNRK